MLDCDSISTIAIATLQDLFTYQLEVMQDIQYHEPGNYVNYQSGLEVLY